MLVSPQASVKMSRNGEQSTGIGLRCPRCFAPIGILQDEAATPFDCQICKSRMACEQGIWKALLPERVARYARFVEDYESIRASEGRGSTNSGVLPGASLSRSFRAS